MRCSVDSIRGTGWGDHSLVALAVNDYVHVLDSYYGVRGPSYRRHTLEGWKGVLEALSSSGTWNQRYVKYFKIFGDLPEVSDKDSLFNLLVMKGNDAPRFKMKVYNLSLRCLQANLDDFKRLSAEFIIAD
jgi:hypothetical protein